MSVGGGKPVPLRLAAPRGGRVDLLIVSGEHSGDEHAARLLRELNTLRPGLAVCALGGPRLAAAGAQLLRDLTAESSIGFAVLSKISHYRALIAEVARWVGEHRPKAVLFVDSSGLNLRIARSMFDQGFSAKAGGPTKALYFISPQIWASRAGRRFKMAQHLDGLAVIFPFEPAKYADTTLPVTFVGHPFVAADYQAPVRYDPNGPVLLLPGSRNGAVARIFPVLLAGFAAYTAEAKDAREAVVLYPSEAIKRVLEAANPPANVRLQATTGGAGPVAAAAVLTSSGTMSMHCALAGIPGVVTYKADPLTYFLGRMLVTVPYLGIANLLLEKAMYPEYIQGAATPAVLARELCSCLLDPTRIAQVQQDAASLRALLAQPAKGSAAAWVADKLT